jgi:Putative bacterial sensory transduction regulator
VFDKVRTMSTSEPNIATVSTESLLSDSATVDAQVEKATEITYPEEIETIIAGMAVDQKVMVGQNEAGGHLWKFKYGSVEVFVQLTGETENDTLTVWAFVLQLPVANEAQLMRKLLEMNWLSTLEAHFAIVDNQVAVVSTRTISEISSGEISRAITIVATIADDNDDVLQAEYK